MAALIDCSCGGMTECVRLDEDLPVDACVWVSDLLVFLKAQMMMVINTFPQSHFHLCCLVNRQCNPSDIFEINHLFRTIHSARN